MAKVILCTGKTSARPYVLRTSGVRIFTIEELCYCLKDQLDMLDETIIDREMAMFIRDDLGLTERGEMLEQLILTKADLKSRLVCIFCTADYYDENEINAICRELDELQSMSPIERSKRRADKYMQEGNYHEAFREYRYIVASPGREKLKAEDYGNVLHNLGVLNIRHGLYDTAAGLFKEAYACNESEESLKCYFYALKLGHRDEEFTNEAMRMLDSGSFMEKLESELADAREHAEQTEEYERIDRLKVLYQQGRVSEFDRLANEMIEGLKHSYRASMDN